MFYVEEIKYKNFLIRVEKSGEDLNYTIFDKHNVIIDSDKGSYDIEYTICNAKLIIDEIFDEVIN